MNILAIKLEKKVNAAYDRAAQYCREGMLMNDAAERALPTKLRQALISKLEALPLPAQATLPKLIEMNAIIYGMSGRMREAIAESQRLIELEIALFGSGATNLELLKAQLRLISFAMKARNMKLAEDTLMTAFLIQCGGSMYSSSTASNATSKKSNSTKNSDIISCSSSSISTTTTSLPGNCGAGMRTKDDFLILCDRYCMAGLNPSVSEVLDYLIVKSFADKRKM